MKSKAQKEEERLREYLGNKLHYDKSIVIATGGLLALIDYLEDANKVAPKVFSNQLKYVIEDFLNSLYKGKEEKEVGEQHNEIAELFRKFINKIEFK